MHQETRIFFSTEAVFYVRRSEIPAAGTTGCHLGSSSLGNLSGDRRITTEGYRAAVLKSRIWRRRVSAGREFVGA